MNSMTHKSVPIALLPKLSFAAKEFICLFCSITFPSIHQLRHWHRLNPKVQMHMVWHHYPGTQIILLTMENTKGILNNSGNLGCRK